MKNRESLRNKLLNTDDETLKRMLSALAAASGMDEARKNAMLTDLPRLRRLLTETSDEQLSALLSSMGTGSLAEALKRMNNNKNNRS